MFDLTRERLGLGVVAPAVARLTTVYQAAAHDVVLPLVGEVSPPPRPHARSFRDRVHSPLGRFITRFLIRWLVIAPLPLPIQQLALLWPVSILSPLMQGEKLETADPAAEVAVSGSVGRLGYLDPKDSSTSPTRPARRLPAVSKASRGTWH